MTLLTDVAAVTVYIQQFVNIGIMLTLYSNCDGLIDTVCQLW